MTISSEVRKAGPYVGNDVTTSFPFEFKVFAASDVVVILTDPAGIETTLIGNGTDYTVNLNADQDASPGGSVVLPAALETGYLLTITSAVPRLQPVALTNQGGFYPSVINQALDRLTIFAQELAVDTQRSVKVPISGATDPDDLIAQLMADAANAAASASAASTSATNAATSATNAANSASAASTSATNAATSATNAANSATNAANSATNAANSATNAANSATNAANSATNAANSAAAAAASAASITLPLPIASGGTGSTTAAAARTALGAGAAGGLATLDAAGKVPWWQLPTLAFAGMFHKADPKTVAFVKTGAGTAIIKAGTQVVVAGTVVTFSSDTDITMPSLTAGTDYAIWVKADGWIGASASFTSAPGGGAPGRVIGGFHYAPGGNAPAMAGGDTTPAINAYSFWDLKFRPACPDPRGMTLVADSFWADIYLLGVDHLINGTSRYNVAIARGSTPPKIPTKFGGDGSTTYSNMNWWVANEVLQSHGKRSPTYDEFAALAYGTTEATSSGGSDVPTTGVNGTGATNTWNKFTSRWGVIQATGCLYVWGAEFGGGAAGAAWAANTGGRGSTWQMENVGVLGGSWHNDTTSGSRCSRWDASPTASQSNIGARGVCDHLIID